MPTYRITGIKAAIDGLQCLRQWKLVLSGVDTVSACSASDGAVLRTAGNADWQITALGYGLPPKYPGEFFTFTGSARNGQGWQSDSLGTIVTGVTIFCPIKSGRHLHYHLFAAANGALAKGAYAAVDGATPAPLNCKGLTFKRDGTAVNGVENWVLKIEGNVTHPTYASHLAGWPKRDAGNIDATLSWQQTFDAMDQLPAINGFYEFQPYVDATRYYDIKWGQVLSTPVDVPIEGEPPGQAEYIVTECRAHFSGYYNSVQGFFKKPGGTIYWPT